jgi:hypothetical protein
VLPVWDGAASQTRFLWERTSNSRSVFPNRVLTASMVGPSIYLGKLHMKSEPMRSAGPGDFVTGNRERSYMYVYRTFPVASVP